MNPSMLMLAGLSLVPLAAKAQTGSQPLIVTPGVDTPGAAAPGVAAPLASAIDTIFVSDTETTYLIFPEEVLLVDIGRTGDYFAKIEGQSVFLKARTQRPGPTNLLIRFGSSYYTARIEMAQLPAGRLYDLRTATAPGSSISGAAAPGAAAPGAAAPGTGIPNPATIRARLLSLKELPQATAQLRRSRHGLSLCLTQLQADRQALYLGMHLRNSSSIAYTLDFVGFSFQEKSGRRLSRNNRYRKEVRPYAEVAPAVIPARGEADLGYALPLFAMTSRGRLQLLFREKEGARMLSLSIPARRINQAPLFPESHGDN